ncbi:Uncharacterised protein [Segatella copri]|nr:Uncharacterised protein [Segatella copri]
MQKTADFRIISFPAHKSKEDLHLFEVLYVVQILTSDFKTPCLVQNPSIMTLSYCMVTIIYIICFFPFRCLRG